MQTTIRESIRSGFFMLLLTSFEGDGIVVYVQHPAGTNFSDPVTDVRG